MPHLLISECRHLLVDIFAVTYLLDSGHIPARSNDNYCNRGEIIMFKHIRK